MRSRFCCSSRTYGVGVRLDLAGLVGQCGRRRHELVGTVVADERLEIEAELVERPLLELFHPHPVLGAQHLVAVHGVGQRHQLRLELAHLAAHLGEVVLTAGPGLLDRRTTLDRGGQRTVQPGQHQVRALADRVSGVGLTDPALAAFLGTSLGLPLLLRRLAQAVGAAVQGAGALLSRAQRQPGLHLTLARQPRDLGET